MNSINSAESSELINKHNEIIVTGSAGVGKSFLIQAIESAVWELAKERFGEERYPEVRTAIKLVAFTGKAAFQVGGSQSILCCISLPPYLYNHLFVFEPILPFPIIDYILLSKCHNGMTFARYRFI